MLSCRCCETAYATANSAAVIAPTIDSAALAGALSAGLDFAALLGALSAGSGTGASALLGFAALLSVLCIAIYGRINAFLTYFSGWGSGRGRQIVIL